MRAPGCKGVKASTVARLFAMTYGKTAIQHVHPVLVMFGAMVALVLAIAPMPALAATVTWTGFSAGPCVAGANSWSVTGGPCWDPHTGPANGDDVVLAQSGPSALSTYDINRTLNSITLNTGATAYTISNAGAFLLGLQSGGFITDNNTNSTGDAINTGITLNGPVTFTLSAGAVGLSFGVNPVTGTGPLTLVNNSTGALILSAANTYTGATSVNAGTVTVNGSLASPVTVNAGGTLGGTGTISHTVTVNSGGTLSPGTSPGIITTGDLTLNGGSTLTIELNGPTAGTQYDQVHVTGMVTVHGATLHVVLGFTPSAGYVFTIINNGGPHPVGGAFAGLAEGATLSVGGTLFRISYQGGDGNDVTLTVVTPFATFTVQQLDLTVRPRINDAFALHARFTLGAGSDGIAPLTEQVKLALTGGTGAFTTTIPAGAFKRTRQGQFTFPFPFPFLFLFKGTTIDAVQLEATITPLGGAVYTVEIAGDQADLTGIANPVTVTLTIGNDSGSTTVQAHIAHGP